MKFQDSNKRGSKIIDGIKKCDLRTNERTHKPKAICPTNVFKVGSIMNRTVL